MKKNKVAFGYRYLPGPFLDEFTTNVIIAMTGNSAFTNPPVPIAPVTTVNAAEPAGQPSDQVIVGDDLTSLQAAFRKAQAATDQGGTQATAAKNQAQQSLCDTLDKLGLYVQTVAVYDLAMLLSSGFQAINTNRAQAQLATPDITELANDLSTQMVVRLTPIDNSYGYEVQTSLGAGAWLTVKLSTAARKIILTDLVPGTVYNVRGAGGGRQHRLQRLEHARFAHGDVREPAAFSRQ